MTSTTLRAGESAELVPSSYAEKAMASLLQLHQEVLEEKERRVDLYRRLMEREQNLAELKMYVQLLEERVARAENTPLPVIEKPRSLMAEPPRVPTLAQFSRRTADPGEVMATAMNRPSSADRAARSPVQAVTESTETAQSIASDPGASQQVPAKSVDTQMSASRPLDSQRSVSQSVASASSARASRAAPARAAPAARKSNDGWKTW